MIDRLICARCDNDETSVIVGMGYSRDGIESVTSQCYLCGLYEVSDVEIFENPNELQLAPIQDHYSKEPH